MTNGDRICDRCKRHGRHCEWYERQQMSCIWCFTRKSICTIDSEPVSKWKPRAGTSGSRSWKRSRVEVESEPELEGNEEVFEEVGKALVGIQEALEEQNALRRESNWYLKGIMRALLEGNKLLSRGPVDSTLKSIVV